MKKFDEVYSGKVEAAADYLLGRAKNRTAEGALDGTPWEKILINDTMLGPLAAILSEAGIIPDGSDEKEGQSQVLDAIKLIIRDQQWGDRFKGSFAKGFTYTNSEDVGRGQDGKYYRYVGSDPFPKVISAGVNPSGNVDYEVVVFGSAKSIINEDGTTSQDTYNTLKAVLISQGLSGEYGYFAEGFTVNDPLDVGIDASFQFWKYVGTETLPYDVPPLTDPNAGDWGLVTFNSSSHVINDDGTTGQDTHDIAKESVRKKTIIYVSATTNNPSANPPIYDSLAGAMASITDNSENKPYEIQMLSGTHDAREILLKDFVDIVRSPLASSEVIIEHDFLPSESFKNRDILKTCLTPYDATDNFPIRCKLKGLFIRGQNLNYALHGDFNESPLIDIQADDCIFFNGDPNTTATTAEYGIGLGVYGRQKYEFNRCNFYGRYDASQTDETRQQGSGWIVHNRLNQDGPCSVTFNDCKSLKGWYGGRIVDYASGHEDTISINGGVLLGEFADLLCFSLAEAVAAPSITVTGSVPLRSVRLTQQASSGRYNCAFPIVVTGFSDMYRADGAVSRGDMVRLNAFQREAGKAVAGTLYKYSLGVAMHDASDGDRLAVQHTGIAAANFTPASISSNTEITVSSTVDGEIDIAGSGDTVLGATLSSTGFSSGITPDKAWISLGYSGIKA